MSLPFWCVLSIIHGVFMHVCMPASLYMLLLVLLYTSRAMKVHRLPPCEEIFKWTTVHVFHADRVLFKHTDAREIWNLVWMADPVKTHVESFPVRPTQSGDLAGHSRQAKVLTLVMLAVMVDGCRPANGCETGALSLYHPHTKISLFAAAFTCLVVFGCTVKIKTCYPNAQWTGIHINACFCLFCIGMLE